MDNQRWPLSNYVQVKKYKKLKVMNLEFSITTENRKLLVLLIIISLPLISFGQKDFGTYDLRTEYLETPIGIEYPQPRFSWKMEAPAGERGYSQTAYQISVKDLDMEVWNSGKVQTDKSIGIKCQCDLNPETRYTWTLTVWDHKNKSSSSSSWFETGLMNPDLEAWEGAKWIGGSEEDMVFYPHAMTVFKMEFTVQLQEGSDRAAFVYGANDRRLMNRNLNIVGVQNEKDESYISLELDISGFEDSEDSARVNIYRVGYAPGDTPQEPFKTLSIPTTIINRENRYMKHKIFVETVFGVTAIYIDGVEEEHMISPMQQTFFGNRPSMSLNPLGSGGDVMAFPVVGDIGFQVSPDQVATFSDISVKNYRDPENALISESGSGKLGTFSAFSSDEGFEITQEGFSISGGDQGTLLIADPRRNSTPMLRTEFSVDKPVAKARLYVTARGIYEMHLNGQRISNDFFNPGATQYYLHHMYQTYDVTNTLTDGNNALGAWLSEGWWSGNITYSGENWNYFGDRQSLLAKLVVEYEDGTRDVTVTDPQSWSLFNDGPVLFGSFFQGEVHDANRESAIEGWAMPGFDDSKWKKATEVSLAGTTPQEHNYDNMELLGQIGVNATIVDTLVAQSVSEVRPGVFIYDMGQNMVGVPRVAVYNTPDNDDVVFRYAEVLYPDLSEHEGYAGMVMMENIRSALTTDIWKTKGGEGVFQPRFTFHGFRYIEVSGLSEAIPLENVQGLVISSVRDIASGYETSNDLVNRLWQI